MNSNNIYTRKTLGLDKNVWRMLFAAIVLPAGLLSYRLIAKKECVPVEFSFKASSAVTGNVFLSGEDILFKASSNANEISWKFGDNEGTESGYNVFHTYKSPGEYIVTASFGLGCENFKTIRIIKPPVDSVKNFVNGKIRGPGITITGKSNSFSFSEQAINYEWVILNHPEMKQTGSTAKFTFSDKGTYTVQLTLDNDHAKRIIKNIIVDEINGGGGGGGGEPPPPGCINVFISDENFKEKIKEVVAGKLTVNNFIPFLSSGGATPVIINEKNEQKDFAWACQFLSGKTKSQWLLWKKSIKINSVHLTRDAKTNTCV